MLAGTFTTFLLGLTPREPDTREMTSSTYEVISRDNFRYEMMFDDMSDIFHLPGVDCQGILNAKNASLDEGIQKRQQKEWRGFQTKEADYLVQTRNCDDFIRQNGYIVDPLSEREERFPLAFSMVVYKDIEQVERLLRAIYRPQNVYCIHVDVKSKDPFFQAMSSIVSCFPNVFLLSPRLDIRWGEFSVLEVELNCMRLLLEKSQLWKYFINLTGDSSLSF